VAKARVLVGVLWVAKVVKAARVIKVVRVAKADKVEWAQDQILVLSVVQKV
jgi:hypothetical protein